MASPGRRIYGMMEPLVKSSADLRTFTRSRFDLVASGWDSRLALIGLQPCYLLCELLFIFVKIFVLALKKCEGLEESLLKH